MAAVELDPQHTAALKAACLGVAYTQTDFLKSEIGTGFDRVVMNPPFTGGQDIDHVRYAFDTQLKPGGRLVAVMSGGTFDRENRKAVEFRRWFEDLGGTVETLDPGTFSESGTNCSSILVTLDKPEAKKGGRS